MDVAAYLGHPLFLDIPAIMLIPRRERLRLHFLLIDLVTAAEAYGTLYRPTETTVAADAGEQLNAHFGELVRTLGELLATEEVPGRLVAALDQLIARAALVGQVRAAEAGHLAATPRTTIDSARARESRAWDEFWANLNGLAGEAA